MRCPGRRDPLPSTRTGDYWRRIPGRTSRPRGQGRFLLESPDIKREGGRGLRAAGRSVVPIRDLSGRSLWQFAGPASFLGGVGPRRSRSRGSSLCRPSGLYFLELFFGTVSLPRWVKFYGFASYIPCL